MEPADVNCPRCETRLHVPPNRDRVICPRCGSAWDASRQRGEVRLANEAPWLADESSSRPLDIVDSRLAELDELIDEIRSEIEALRSRELSSPLQLGCSFFGIFFAVTLVLAVFMLLGKGYFGGWIFYLCIALVVALGVDRIRRKVKARVGPADLRHQRTELEQDLTELESERDRIAKLKANLTAFE